jgi:hypothetical protein
MADLISQAILARAEGGEKARTVDALIADDRPDLTGGIEFVASDRHATYVEIDAYRRQMTKIRKRFGWPELKDGVFARLRVGAAKAAAE